MINPKKYQQFSNDFYMQYKQHKLLLVLLMQKLFQSLSNSFSDFEYAPNLNMFKNRLNTQMEKVNHSKRYNTNELPFFIAYTQLPPATVTKINNLIFIISICLLTMSILFFNSIGTLYHKKALK